MRLPKRSQRMNELMAKVANLSVNRIAVFGLLLTVLYYIGIYDNGSALSEQLVGISAQIAEETTKKTETEKILKKEEEMRADVATLAKTYETVKSKIPTEFESSELRTIVEQLSAASNLKIAKLSNVEQSSQSASIPSSDDANLVEKVAIDYTFRGNYAQLQNFMIQLSNVEKVIKMSDLKIRVVAEGSSPIKFLTIDARVIGYKQAPVTTATPQTPQAPNQSAPEEVLK